MKYIVISGGVISGLGKGIVSASLGRILESKGYTVTVLKIDPYLNQDAGTMNPIEHGEVFVLDDGAEVDMDFGHYERYLNVDLTGDHNITTGKIYQTVLDKERKGDYLGQTVQIIPHVINEIVGTIKGVSKKAGADIAIVELGGTVGDIESMPFIEAVRQMKAKMPEDVVCIHVTLVPKMTAVGEQKTKPTQHSVRMLREAGLEPDIIVCRADEKLLDTTKKKIALFCNVEEEAVISNPDCKSIYEVPLVLQDEKLGELVLGKFGLKSGRRDLRKWRERVERIVNTDKRVLIAISGKYMKLHDSYTSIKEALVHAGVEAGVGVDVVWVDTEEFEKDPKKAEELAVVDGILVPGGFGSRGAEGKIIAIKYAREHGIPFLGLCFGLQLAVVEFARNVAHMTKANSSEIDPNTPYPVIDFLPEQKDMLKLGGTMRLGAYPAKLEKGTTLRKLYGRELISERHRHRYEVNPDYIKQLEKAGLVFSGRNPNRPVMETIEYPKHPFFAASQFHPEFKSKMEKPSPMFVGFVQAAADKKTNKKKGKD